MMKTGFVHLILGTLYCCLQAHELKDCGEKWPCVKDASAAKISYTCSNLPPLDNITRCLGEAVHSLVIQDSNITFQNVSHLHQVIEVETLNISKSFLSESGINWLNSLDSLKKLVLRGAWTSKHVLVLYKGKIEVSPVLEYEMSSNLKNLKEVYILNSDLVEFNMSRFFKENNFFPKFTVSDSRVDCYKDFSWLHDLVRSKASEAANVTCIVHYINYTDGPFPTLYSLTGKNFMPVMMFREHANTYCPQKCSCKVLGMRDEGRPQLNVDCRQSNLTELPSIIPPGTSRCDFSLNMIQDISPLYNNEYYSRVTNINISFNNITYIHPEQFSTFLMQHNYDIGVLLHHNQLTKFPAKEIKDLYEKADGKNLFGPQIYLGYNPYICSCDYIEDFQTIIFRRMYNIPDILTIKCSQYYNSEPELVLFLEVGSLCGTEHLLTNLDLLNITMAFILLVLIIDFVRNYYQFKKHEKLPWIVTRFKC